MSNCNSTSINTPKQSKRFVKDTTTFITKCQEVHGDLYDYSKVVYVRSKDKVVIVCHKHGDFMQAANNHTQGQHCPDCKKESRLVTKKEFVERAIAKHGTSYGYEKVNLTKGLSEKVSIYCKSCKLYFSQVASEHVRGYGCLKCFKDSHYLNLSEFLKRSKEKHGDLYSYESVVYKRVDESVSIYCKKCNYYFEQIPAHHMSGHGCAKCNWKGQSLTQQQFEARSLKVHGDNYSYELAVYEHNSKSVKIYCKKCQCYFKQKAGMHVKGHGCQKCAKLAVGWGGSDFRKACDKNNKGVGLLYVIRCFKENEQFYKVGITSRSVRARFTTVRFPYDYELVALIDGLPDYIYDLETAFHRLLSERKYSPELKFDGQTECFTTIKPIVRLLQRLQSSKQLQLIA